MHAAHEIARVEILAIHHGNRGISRSSGRSVGVASSNISPSCSQVPPKLSWDSRMAKLIRGHCDWRWYAQPIPEIPAPTIKTSKGRAFLRPASVGVALSAMSFDLFQLHPIAAGLAHMLPGSGLSDKSRRVTPPLRSISQAPTYVPATMRFVIGAPCQCKTRENADGPIVEKDRYNHRWLKRNRTRELSSVNSRALVVDGRLLGGRLW